MEANPENIDAVTMEIERVLSTWESQGVPEGCMAVLFSRGHIAREFERRLASWGRGTVLPKEHFDSDKLCVGSVKQFKGLERWCVLVVGPIADNGPELYVASSRAVGKLAYLDKCVDRLRRPASNTEKTDD